MKASILVVLISLLNIKAFAQQKIKPSPAYDNVHHEHMADNPTAPADIKSPVQKKIEADSVKRLKSTEDTKSMQYYKEQQNLRRRNNKVTPLSKPATKPTNP